MKKLWIFLLLSGCVTATPMYGPDGKPYTYINCASNPLDFCLQKANEVCPNGYYLADRETYQNAQLVLTNQIGAGGTLRHNSIVVACK